MRRSHYQGLHPLQGRTPWASKVAAACSVLALWRRVSVPALVSKLCRIPLSELSLLTGRRHSQGNVTVVTDSIQGPTLSVTLLDLPGVPIALSMYGFQSSRPHSKQQVNNHFSAIRQQLILGLPSALFLQHVLYDTESQQSSYSALCSQFSEKVECTHCRNMTEMSSRAARGPCELYQEQGAEPFSLKSP